MHAPQQQQVLGRDEKDGRDEGRRDASVEHGLCSVEALVILPCCRSGHQVLESSQPSAGAKSAKCIAMTSASQDPGIRKSNPDVR